MAFINDIVRAAFHWTSPSNQNNTGYFHIRNINNFEFIGEKAGTTYHYLGYKAYNSPAWKIVRYNPNDESEDFQYVYGDSGFATAWANPENLTYSNPPD